jgi:hypothetical protein
VVTVSARTIGVAYRPVENPGDSVFYLMDLPKEVRSAALSLMIATKRQ